MRLQKLRIRDVTNQFNANSRTSKADALSTTPLVGGMIASSMYRSFGTNNTPTDHDNNHNSNEISDNKDSHSSNIQRPVSVSGGVQRPNRFTTIYSAMQEKCRVEIETYANCVMMAQHQQHHHHQEREMMEKNVGTTYHMCAAEFAPVKECFRTVRRRLRQQQQL